MGLCLSANSCASIRLLRLAFRDVETIDNFLGTPPVLYETDRFTFNLNVLVVNVALIVIGKLLDDVQLSIKGLKRSLCVV